MQLAYNNWNIILKGCHRGYDGMKSPRLKNSMFVSSIVVCVFYPMKHVKEGCRHYNTLPLSTFTCIY